MTPKSDHEEDMSMEEILASIRKFVTDNPSEDPHKQKVYGGDLAESVVIPPAGHASSRELLENPPRRASSAMPAGMSSAPMPSMSTHLYDPEALDLRSPPSPGIGSNRDPRGEWGESTAPVRSQFQKTVQEESIMTLTNPLESKKMERFGRQSTKPAQMTEQEEGLGSPYALSASANSLSRLAQATKFSPKKSFSSLADQRNVTLDQLIQDMIRPMIKQWIDAHLSSLVEEMVAKEIKRITKHLG